MVIANYNKDGFYANVRELVDEEATLIEAPDLRKRLIVCETS
ncbi:MAG: hypothetical protein WCE82_06605 [Halobacteriota archaeon]